MKLRFNSQILFAGFIFLGFFLPWISLGIISAAGFQIPFALQELSRFGGGGTTCANGCLPPCRADFNSDGNLDPDDLADYISCYFSNPPCARADFNTDGVADPDDLADFISAFFAGC